MGQYAAIVETVEKRLMLADSDTRLFTAPKPELREDYSLGQHNRIALR